MDGENIMLDSGMASDFDDDFAPFLTLRAYAILE